jgi:hypothetical protein
MASGDFSAPHAGSEPGNRIRSGQFNLTALDPFVPAAFPLHEFELAQAYENGCVIKAFLLDEQKIPLCEALEYVVSDYRPRF